ncbi:MAG TPA: XRE family transcriptional regulator [Blastocatellia bacterium]|nr:XRE family transcriptional regulator [Blastocatellia bacterium]
MPASIPALVTPSVLEWARKESGYELGPVAKKLQVRPEKVLAWEHGEAKPTLRQAQALAKVYHRPLGVFYLPQPPSVPPVAAEYRRLPGIPPGTETPELRLAVRVMSLRREVAIQLSDEMGHPIDEFNAAAHQSESSAAVGGRLRKLLGIEAQEQLDWRDEWQAWRRWREAVERAGVLVFQFPKVNLNQVRGVTLPLFPMPVIGINSKETSAAARSYTLIHELTHLALARGHEEEVALRESRTERGLQELERFAEEVASAVLIPEDLLMAFLERMSVPRNRWDVPLVRRLAYTFRVTPLAMATRLRSTGALTWNGYQRWKRDWDAYVETLRPRKGGFASPAEKSLGRSGRPFAQLVLEALDANRITSVDASRYLELSFDHVEKLRLELAKGAEAGFGNGDGGD